MAQVSVTINARRYEIACDDGQEEHVLRLAEDVDARVARLVASLGQVGDARLLVLASLLLADELAEVRGAIPAAGDRAGADVSDAGQARAEGEAEGLDVELAALARRIATVAGRLQTGTIAEERDPF